MGLPCQLVSWDEFAELAHTLARMIAGSGFRPEMIVAIARGGSVPARVLSDQLDVFDLATVKIEHYRGAHKSRQARIRYPLDARVDQRRVLVVDDVSDSGDTFEVALSHVRERGTPAALKTAVLHHKRTSSFVPDYFASEVTEWRWIIYPWAVMEDLRSFLAEMTPRPRDIESLAAQLQDSYGLSVPDPLLADVLESSLDATN
jgi:hypoxanthine phosphoribosyltransferase